MPKQDRNKTEYRGVYWIESTVTGTSKRDRIYCIRYKIDGRLVEEKAGRASKGMTAARANALRTLRITEKEPTNQDRREAEAAAKIAEQERPTLSRLWKLYDENHTARKDRKSDSSRWTLYIEPTFGKLTPDEIAPLDVDRWRMGLAKEKSNRGRDKDGKLPKNRPLLSKGTQSRILELLRRLIRFGVDREIIDVPRWRVKLPKVDNEKTERLDSKQTAALLDALRAESLDRDAADALLIAWGSGLRKMEILALPWANVDMAGGWLRITNRKGGKSATVPMTPMVREVLARREILKTTSHGTIEGKTNKPLFVFPADSESGHREDISRFQRRLRTALKLPADFRMAHGLRHDYASRLAERGESLLVIAELLGHENVNMSKRYSHLSNERLKAAAEGATEAAGLPLEAGSGADSR
jgi:integrase